MSIENKLFCIISFNENLNPSFLLNISNLFYNTNNQQNLLKLLIFIFTSFIFRQQ